MDLISISDADAGPVPAANDMKSSPSANKVPQINGVVNNYYMQNSENDALENESNSEYNEDMESDNIYFEVDPYIFWGNNVSQHKNVIMQKQAPYYANKERLPDVDYSYTSDCFVKWKNHSIGNYTLMSAIPIENNSELTTFLEWSVEMAISQAQKDLANGLIAFGIEKEAIPGIMTALKLPRHTEAMIDFLMNNLQATQSDILRETHRILNTIR